MYIAVFFLNLTKGLHGGPTNSSENVPINTQDINQHGDNSISLSRGIVRMRNGKLQADLLRKRHFDALVIAMKEDLTLAKTSHATTLSPSSCASRSESCEDIGGVGNNSVSGRPMVPLVAMEATLRALEKCEEEKLEILESERKASILRRLKLQYRQQSQQSHYQWLKYMKSLEKEEKAEREKEKENEKVLIQESVSAGEGAEAKDSTAGAAGEDKEEAAVDPNAKGGENMTMSFEADRKDSLKDDDAIMKRLSAMIELDEIYHQTTNDSSDQIPGIGPVDDDTIDNSP